jgi:hypothetical protein
MDDLKGFLVILVMIAGPVVGIGIAVASDTHSAPLASAERRGAVCNDAWVSSATGRGACSSHGGVARWLHHDEELCASRDPYGEPLRRLLGQPTTDTPGCLRPPNGHAWFQR